MKKFNIPQLEEGQVKLLADLASKIDGAINGEWEELLVTFNKNSGLDCVMKYEDFQGIYGAEAHDLFVRRLLALNKAVKVNNLTKDDISQTFEKILDGTLKEWQSSFLIESLSKSLNDPELQDIIYYPGEYLKSGDNSVQLSPIEMSEIVLKKFNESIK